MKILIATPVPSPGATGQADGHRPKGLMGRPSGINTAKAFYPYGIITTEAFHWAGWAGRAGGFVRMNAD